MNSIAEFVYPLCGYVFDYAFVDAHDLIYIRHDADGFETIVCNQIDS